MKIKIITKYGEVNAELNGTETAKEIYDNLPIEGEANVWGEEIYFKIPVSRETEEPKKRTMEIGDLAYWSEGKAFCIFFGKTPASIDENPRAISDVTFLGRAKNIEMFKKVKDNEKITLDKAEENMDNKEEDNEDE